MTNSVKTALEAAKAAAQAVNVDGATSTAVAAQESALKKAINTYENAIQTGTQNEVTELRTALGVLIGTAETIKKTTVDTDAKNVAPGTEWVTSEVQSDYTKAIGSATTVKDNNSATAAELAEAIVALNGAISTYIKAIQKGAELDNSALVAAINAANINAASVAVSADGTDVLPSNNWVTQTVKDAYTGAIGTAKNTSATKQSDYDTALATLNTATDTFNKAKKAGSKDIIAPVVTNVNATLDGTTATISFTTNEAGSYSFKVGDKTKSEDKSIGVAGKVSFTVANYKTADTETNPAITVTVADASGNATTFKVVPTSKVVQVGDDTNNTYETLAAAVAAAQDGDTIKLLKDVTGAGVLFNRDIKVTLDLNGKTFKATSNGNTTNHRVVYVTAGELTIQNGTLDSRMTPDKGSYASTTGKDTDFYGTVRAKDSKVTLENLTLYNNHNWGMSVKADAKGTISVKDCQVYSTVGGGLESAGGSITVEGSTFKQSGSNASYRYIASGLAVSYGGTVDIYNTNFATEGDYALYVYSTGGTINVYGGVFSGKVNSVHADTMETATADSVVNIYDGEFEGSIGIGGTSSKYANKISITGGTFDNDPSAYLAETYAAEKNEDGNWVVKTAAASIGETEYATLAEAVAAVHQETDPDKRMTETTITLQRDAVGGGFGVGYAKIENNTTSGNNPVSIVIDLNGHTYTAGAPTVGSAGTETNVFQMLKGSKVTFKNGTIRVAEDSKVKILFQNYCDFVLEDVTVDITESSAAYAVSNNFGSFTAKGSTVINAEGKVAFDLWYGMNGSGLYDDGVTVCFGTDFTGTVTGQIEYGADNRAAEMEWAAKTKLTIAGGTFHTTIVDSNSKDKVEAKDFNISITGGTFSVDPNDYLEEGYEAVENGDGTWTVAEATETNTVATANTDAGDETDKVNAANLGDVDVNDAEKNDEDAESTNTDKAVVNAVVANNKETDADEGEAA